MEWLESLARRQGANPDELTTAADFDIPLPGDASKVTGPGYTPFDTGSSKPAPVAAKPPPPPSAPMEADPFGGMDPMEWLESLAKRQGANPDELTTAADLDVAMPDADAVQTGPGYTPYKATSTPPMPEQPKTATSVPTLSMSVPVAARPPAPPAAQPPAASQDEDPFSGMDPMEWLESLAKRQGANPDELTTAADFDIPMPAADAMQTGPGYTPYEASSRAEPVKPDPVKSEPIKAQTATNQMPAAGTSDDDLLGGMDPMAWLEALARRQGANPDELITGGMAEVPEAPSMAIPNEPGYVDYAPFAEQPLSGEFDAVQPESRALPPSAARPPTPPPAVRPPAPPPSSIDDMDPLRWLNALSESDPQPMSDPSMFSAGDASEIMQADSALDWLESLARETGDAPPASQPVSTIEDWLASARETPPEPGLSDNPQEILAWLNEQAAGLVEDETAGEAPVSDTPAALAPAEIPEWLRDQMGTPAATSNILRDEVVEPPVPIGLDDWMRAAEPDADSTLDLSALFAAESADVPSGELQALTLPTPGEAADPWAEALDDEYRRERAGDTSIPDWFNEVMARSEDAPVSQQQAAPQARVEVPAEVPEVSVPNYLSEMESEFLGEPILENIPDWLRGADPGLPRDAAPTPEPQIEIDDWTTPTDDLLPDWLRPEVEPALAAQPEPVQPPPPVLPPRQPEPVSRETRIIELDRGIFQTQPPTRTNIVTPQQAQPVPVYTPQPEPATALQSARTLIAANQHLDSLHHLEPLVDSGHQLDDVVTELQKVVAAQPKSPRARRLLGDAHMRQGDLQKALDSYRSALEQL